MSLLPIKKLKDDYRCGFGLPQLKLDRLGDFGKDIFRDDARRFMKSVGLHLSMLGYAEHRMHWSEGGPAVSGDCYVTASKVGAPKVIKAWVTQTMVRIDRPDGLIITARVEDRHGRSGRNMEPSLDYDSEQLARWLHENIGKYTEA